MAPISVRLLNIIKSVQHFLVSIIPCYAIATLVQLTSETTKKVFSRDSAEACFLYGRAHAVAD